MNITISSEFIFIAAVSRHCRYTRARGKVLGLAYVKFGTNGRWVGTETVTGVTMTLVYS